MSTALKLRPTVSLAFIVEPDGQQFHAYCPQLKGLHIDGPSEEEALKRAIEAAELYLQSLERHDESFSHDVREEIPEGAVLRTVTLEWPSTRTFGIS
jgi:predicted RNase H-like HicB family nuclease